MTYYLSYVLNSDKEWGGPNNKMPQDLYPVFLALTEHNPPEAPKIISRIGFYDPNQLEMKNFLQLSEKRKYFHKTYAITEEQMLIFMNKLNADRRIGLKNDKQGNSLIPEELLTDYEKIKYKERPYRNEDGELIYDFEGHHLRAVPRRSGYNFYQFNCKTYALSLMKAMGIVDSSLSNWFIDNPDTGNLSSLKFTVHPDPKLAANNILVWKSPLIASKPLNFEKKGSLDTDKFKEMQFSLKYNDFKGLVKNIIPALEDPNLKKLMGINLLLLSFRIIEKEMEDLDTKYSGYVERLSDINRYEESQLKNVVKGILSDNEKHDFDRYCQQHQHQNLRNVAKEFLLDLKHQKIGSHYNLWLQQAENAFKQFEKHPSNNLALQDYIKHSLKMALNYLKANFKISSKHGAKHILHGFKQFVHKPLQSDAVHFSNRSVNRLKPP